MKILFIASIYPTEQHPDYGTYVKNVYDIMVDNGYDVKLTAYKRMGSKIDKLKNLWLFYREIKSDLVNQENYDLINVHYPFLSSIPIWLYLKRITVPLFISAHGSDIFSDSKLKSFLFHFTLPILKKSDKIFVPSASFRDKVLKNYDLRLDQFFVFPPGGYDESRFFPGASISYPINNDELMKVINREPSTKWLGYAGRLVKGKGWDLLMEAFMQISNDSQYDHYKLAFVGSGPDRDEINKIIEKHNLKDRVLMLGPLNPDEMAVFYNQLEVFIFPTSYEESLGIVGIEALACGIPVIASSSGAIPEYITDGYNGYLVEPGNSSQLKNAITRFIDLSDEDKVEMSNNALNSVKKYSAKVLGEKLDLFLHEVIH